MEHIADDRDVVFHNYHYYDAASELRSTESMETAGVDFSSEFHTFALEWEETEMRWYVDDVKYQTQTVWHTKNYDYPAPFDQKFHMILNVAVGGNWPGSPDETTTFPQKMEVDYVRVYQKNP